MKDKYLNWCIKVCSRANAGALFWIMVIAGVIGLIAYARGARPCPPSNPINC